jgi:ribosomal protein S6
MSLYEGMFLLDNQAVRADWKAAKSAVTGTLEKHGATVRTARRWDERKLAYPIKHRLRGTYVLAYYDLGADSIDSLRHDLELSEIVLRYLLVRTDGVPADEAEKAAAEEQEGYVPPAPPEDDEPEVEARPEPEAKDDDGDDDGDDEDEDEDEATSEGEGSSEAAAERAAPAKAAASEGEAPEKKEEA